MTEDGSHIVIDQTGTIDEQITAMGRAARGACRRLSALSAGDRSRILRAMAEGIVANRDAITSANDRDMAAGAAAGLSEAMLDRLKLDAARLDAMATGLREVADLPDVLGQVLDRRTHANGMIIEKVRVPLGVIGMIYESRPNVTADAAGLCFKSGNAVILRGGSEAVHSNRAIHQAMLRAGSAAGLPDHAVQLIESTDRAAVNVLLSLEQSIDLIIPRGGEGLIRAVAEHSRVPVLKHYKGVCHVYVDRAADLDMALQIVINAKCQRPGVCNAMETLLVHRDVAESFLPRAAAELLSRGVELRGDARTCTIVPEATPAAPDDWSAEYLALVLSIAIVEDLDAAIEHIARFGTQHSDVIVTGDDDAAERFLREVDSAAVYVNASSRFTDGSAFGMGAEIGISTDKLHARGPCGIEELTTYKWIVRGSGQIRS